MILHVLLLRLLEGVSVWVRVLVLLGLEGRRIRLLLPSKVVLMLHLILKLDSGSMIGGGFECFDFVKFREERKGCVKYLLYLCDLRNYL